MDSDMLIALVFSKPPLWDKTDKRHCNRHVIDKCWKEIRKAMDQDENLLRKKWKYLRDHFSVEHAKITESRSGDGASTSCEPKWPYYKSLLFLKDMIKPRKSSGDLSKLKRPSSSTSVEAMEQTNDSNDSQDDSNLNQDDLNPDQRNLNNPYDFEASTSTELPRESYSVPSKKKKLNTFNQSMSNIEKLQLEYLKKKRSQNEDDNNLLFLKSLLPHIRKIPPERLFSFRNEIQSTVDMYAYQSQFSSNSSHSNYSPYTIAPPSTHQTPESPQSQLISATLQSPPSTYSYQSPHTHTTQSDSATLQSPPSTYQSPDTHTNQLDSATLKSPPSTHQSPDTHTTQLDSATLQSPPSTYQSPDTHTTQLDSATLQSPPSTYQSPDTHTTQLDSATLQSPPSAHQSPDTHTHTTQLESATQLPQAHIKHEKF